MDTQTLIQLAPILGAIGLAIALVILVIVKRMPVASEEMAELGEKIHAGSMVFLRSEYSLLMIFVVVVSGLLFAFDMMGGGDVKLLSTTAVWAGPEHIALFIVTTAIIGGMVSVARMVWVVLARAGMEISAVPLARIPYGLAIAGGGMFVAAQLLMG